MSGSASNSGESFDLRRIRRLVELMNEHNLSEIDLRNGDTRIRLCRNLLPQGAARTAATVSPAPASATEAAAKAESGDASAAHVATIKSPMVGTFYAASSPDAQPFVKVGDPVGPETTVCIVEAMKVFNEIPAEMAGKIVAVLVENGEPVEFGQPLFKVDTRT